MDIDDVPVLGSVVTVLAAGGDLLLNGGEVIFSLVAFALASPDMWVTALFYLERLAGLVAWIPGAVIDQLLVVGLVLLVSVTVTRFVVSWRESTEGGS